MRTLVAGFVVFVLWSIPSTYIYVCKIQDLCSEPISLQANTPSPESKMLNDTLTKVNVKEQKVDAKEQALLNEIVVNYFEFDKSEFKVNDLTKKFSDESNVYLKQHTNARMIITGHTDAIGSEEYNQKLGYRRALSAKQYFESVGITAEKISIESKGEIQPVDSNSTKEGRANNRRTEIIINK
ncbi:MAG TPA: OmpA family protein [Anaerovoracaceae bacterium]|nr:OmpA family protein [Anaerovoracaceae bacterium]